MEPVRVDDGCHDKLTMRSRGTPAPRPFDTPKPHKTLYQGAMEPRSARIDDSFDADLKRALEMSLEDAKGTGSSGFVSQSQLQSHSKPSTSRAAKKEPQEEEDADMEEQKKKYAVTFKQQTASSSASAPFVAPKNDYELTPVEAENINLFSTLVDRLQHQPPGTILREPQIQELYESIGKLRPKLARTYGETMSKHGMSFDATHSLSH
jgi:growth factor-regulated tyrosine kinase substrate